MAENITRMTKPIEMPIKNWLIKIRRPSIDNGSIVTISGIPGMTRIVMAMARPMRVVTGKEF
jgi:hypothetical protein